MPSYPEPELELEDIDPALKVSWIIWQHFSQLGSQHDFLAYLRIGTGFILMGLALDLSIWAWDHLAKPKLNLQTRTILWNYLCGKMQDHELHVVQDHPRSCDQAGLH